MRRPAPMEDDITSLQRRRFKARIRKKQTLAHLVVKSLLFMKVSHFREVSSPSLPAKILALHLIHPNVLIGFFFFIVKHGKPLAFLKFCFLPVFAYLATLTAPGVPIAMLTGSKKTATVSVFLLSFVHLASFMLVPILIGFIDGSISLYKGMPIFTFTYPGRLMSIWNATTGKVFPFLVLSYSYPYKLAYSFYLVIILDAFLLVMNLAYLEKRNTHRKGGGPSKQRRIPLYRGGD